MVVDTFEIGSVERVRLMKLEGWKLFLADNPHGFEYRHPDGRVVDDSIFTIPDHMLDIVIHPTPKSNQPPMDPFDREDAWLQSRGFFNCPEFDWIRANHPDVAASLFPSA